MPNLSKENYDNSKQSSYFPKSNAIVVPHLSECVFRKDYFEKLLHYPNEDSLNVGSCSVAILTVLGSNENQLRLEYTKRLISFLKNEQKSHMSTLEPFNKFWHVDMFSNSSPEIHVWPTVYKINREKVTDTLVLIMFTNEGNVQALQHFAAVASSNIYYLGDADKETLQDQIKDLFGKVDKKPGHFLSCESLSSEQASKTFFGQLVPMKRTNGDDLQFREIPSFLKNVEVVVNANTKAINQPKNPMKKDKSDFVASPYATCNEKPGNCDSKVDQVTEMVANLNICESTQEQQPPLMSDRAAQDGFINNNSNSGDISGGKSCEELGCGPILTCLEKQICDWITTYLNPRNISSLVPCCQHCMANDKHNIFNELHELTDIIQLYNTQLCNLFDNYVCFVEATDVKQFQVLTKIITRRSLKKLISKNHKHAYITNKILKVAVDHLNSFYVNSNINIEFVEEKTAKKVNERLVKEYQKWMIKILNEKLENNSIQSSHILLKEVLMSKAEKCMNIGDRFNGIAKKYLVKLSEKLELAFRNLKKHHIKTECSPLVLDAYIEDYLTIFYGKQAPNFTEQTMEELFELHNRACAKVTSQVHGARKSCLKFRLDMHLSYIVEKINLELTFQNVGTKATINPFCIHLLPDSYVLYSPTHSETQNCIVSHKRAFVALTSKSTFIFDDDAFQFVNQKSSETKAYGWILDLVSDGNVRGNQSLVRKFFKKILGDIENATNNQNNDVIIIIPEYIFVKDRLWLRFLAESAGMRHIFIKSEASLLAFSQISLNKGVKNSSTEVFVTIQIYRYGICITIYEKDLENRIQVISLALQYWQNGILEAGTSREQLMIDYNATLKSALGLAFSQVDYKLDKQPIKYFINGNVNFDKVFEGLPNWDKIKSNLCDDITEAVMYFIKNPYCLVFDIMDHGISTEHFTRLEKTIFADYLKFEQSSHDLTLSQHPSLVDNKQKLLILCKTMRNQLTNGSVNVRRLTNKFITESINRAEKIATDNYTTQEMIASEHQELYELFIEHNFSGLTNVQCFSIKK